MDVTPRQCAKKSAPYFYRGFVMKYTVTFIALLLSGCASQQQTGEFEDVVIADHHCPGEIDRSYSTTIYSSDEPEKVGKTEVITRCNPVKTETEFERDLRQKH
jgi:hypothetical protein